MVITSIKVALKEVQNFSDIGNNSGNKSFGLLAIKCRYMVSFSNYLCRIAESQTDYERGETVSHDDINWD